MKFTHTLTSNWENAIHGLRHPYESYNKSDSAFGIGKEEDIIPAKSIPILAYEESEIYYKPKTEAEYYFNDNGIIRENKKSNVYEYAFIGPEDMGLAQRMIKAGSPNDKFLRQIFVSVDITGPLYWWKELDTYKVGTTANSTSTMHKLASTPITLDCFEIDDFNKNLGIGLWACAEGKEYTPEPKYDNPIKSGYIQKINKETKEVIECTTFYSKDYNRDSMVLENIIEGQINFFERLRQLYLETKDVRYWKELIRWLPESWLQTRTFTCNYAVLRNIIHWRTGHKLTEWGQFIEWCRTLPYADELLFYNQPFDK